MKIIYTDSSYDWNTTDENGCGVGEICIAENYTKYTREKIKICVPGLKQLNNRFELIAIQLALTRYPDADICSDSQVAVGWARNEKVSWVPREINIAGHILDDEIPKKITSIKPKSEVRKRKTQVSLL